MKLELGMADAFRCGLADGSLLESRQTRAAAVGRFDALDGGR
jgi:hypothetical protein